MASSSLHYLILWWSLKIQLTILVQGLTVSYDEKVCCHDSCTPLAVVGRSGPVDGRPLLLLFALVLKGALPGFLSAHGPHPELD